MSPDPLATEDSRQDKKGKPNGSNTPVEIEIAKWTKRMSVATIWLAIGTTMLALLTFRLSCDSDTQLGLTRQAIKNEEAFAIATRDSTHISDSIQRNFDTAQLNRMGAQDSATWYQATLLRNNARIQLRAYVSDGPMVYADDRGRIWSVDFVNHGETPAFDVQGSINAIYDKDPPNEHNFILSVANEPKAITIEPGDKKTAVFERAAKGSHDDSAAYLSGKEGIYYFGRIVYTDVFGNSDTTLFRKQSFISYGVGNTHLSDKGNYQNR